MSSAARELSNPKDFLESIIIRDFVREVDLNKFLTTSASQYPPSTSTYQKQDFNFRKPNALIETINGNWELVKQFPFDANADEVVSFIMDSPNWQKNNLRRIEVVDHFDAWAVMRADLSAGPGHKNPR